MVLEGSPVSLDRTDSRWVNWTKVSQWNFFGSIMHTCVSLCLAVFAMSPYPGNETWAAPATAMPPGPKNKEFAVWGPLYLWGEGGCSRGIGRGVLRLKLYGNLTMLHVKFCLSKAKVTKDQKHQKPFLERDYLCFALENKVMKQSSYLSFNQMLVTHWCHSFFRENPRD